MLLAQTTITLLGAASLAVALADSAAAPIHNNNALARRKLTTKQKKIAALNRKQASLAKQSKAAAKLLSSLSKKEASLTLKQASLVAALRTVSAQLASASATSTTTAPAAASTAIKGSCLPVDAFGTDAGDDIKLALITDGTSLYGVAVPYRVTVCKDYCPGEDYDYIGISYETCQCIQMVESGATFIKDNVVAAAKCDASYGSVDGKYTDLFKL